MTRNTAWKQRSAASRTCSSSSGSISTPTIRRPTKSAFIPLPSCSLGNDNCAGNSSLPAASSSLGGFVVSHFFSQRLSQPVEKLAVVSEENRAQRQRAEAKLEATAEELQRSARFSADASHQLKSPITVLRAGLDSLLDARRSSTGNLRGNLIARSPDLPADGRGRGPVDPLADGCRGIATESARP